MLKFFNVFYRLQKNFMARESLTKNYKKKAMYAVIGGFSKAGMYLFS